MAGLPVASNFRNLSSFISPIQTRMHFILLTFLILAIFLPTIDRARAEDVEEEEVPEEWCPIGYLRHVGYCTDGHCLGRAECKASQCFGPGNCKDMCCLKASSTCPSGYQQPVSHCSVRYWKCLQPGALCIQGVCCVPESGKESSQLGAIKELASFLKKEEKESGPKDWA